MQSVRNSSRLLEEASATGEAILFKYSEQRERLKVISNYLYALPTCHACR